MVATVVAARRSMASDAELVSAVRADDDAAFEELYRRYRLRVTAFVRHMVRDPARAEDIVQDAFLSALRRLRETNAPITFKPWIYEIARNASIDAFRRAGRTEEVSIDVDGGLAAADASRLSLAAGPDISLIQKQRFENLCGALDELSEPHHRIIVLRELEGLSYREIAERMELSTAAVESTLFRARRKLEHEYDQLDTGRRCRHMAQLIGRLAEGLESSRDRQRLDRHARRCSQCRRRARQLGVEPVLRRSIGARVAALLPLPALLRRRSGEPDAGMAADSSNAAGHLAPVLAPAFETAASLAGKLVAVLAAAVVVGGSGMTLGGVGPVADATLGSPADMPAPRDPGPPAGGSLMQQPAWPNLGSRRAGSEAPRPADGGVRGISRPGPVAPERFPAQASPTAPQVTTPPQLPAIPPLHSTPSPGELPVGTGGAPTPLVPPAQTPAQPQLPEDGIAAVASTVPPQPGLPPLP